MFLTCFSTNLNVEFFACLSLTAHNDTEPKPPDPNFFMTVYSPVVYSSSEKDRNFLRNCLFTTFLFNS